MEDHVDWLYDDWAGGDLRICVYCGELAHGIDHVPPLTHAIRMLEISKEELLATALKRVPCCQECNSLAGAVYHATLSERRAYIRKRLTKKYKSLLAAPLWDEDELSDMGFHLQGRIRRLDHTARKVRSRVAYYGLREGRHKRKHPPTQRTSQSKTPSTQLTEALARIIWQKHKAGHSTIRHLVERYGVSKPVVEAIISGGPRR